MKVCVFGAGGVGGYMATCLHRAGLETSVVARGAQLAAIRDNGLRLRAPDGETVSRVAASSDTLDLGPQDAVFVTVKAPALPSVAATIAPLLGPRTPVIFVMNGVPWWYFHQHGGPLDDHRLASVDPGDRMRMAVDPGRVIGGVIYTACEVPEPGVVAVGTTSSRLILGECDDRRSSRALNLADHLCRGGLNTRVSQAIRDEIWAKLISNMASGPLAVLTQAPVDRIAAAPERVELLRQMLVETASVAHGLGRAPELDPDATIEAFRNLHHKPSILSDLEKGRTMEIDALWHTTLDLARLAGVATPTLDAIVSLAELRAQAEVPEPRT